MVFAAKYRRKVFDGDATERLRIIFAKTCAVSNLVNSLKGVSVRLLRKERPDILKRYCKAVLWSASYFASSCGGAPILIVRQYIEQQQTPH